MGCVSGRVSFLGGPEKAGDRQGRLFWGAMPRCLVDGQFGHSDEVIFREVDVGSDVCQRFDIELKKRFFKQIS